MYLLISIIRNFLFSFGIIKSRHYTDVFVLCVGNIRVGGTGKTPMIEYLIRNLQDKFSIAVVSLGYKRKTKGLREVQTADTAEKVGDEPKQMKAKFPKIPFFVSKDRNLAIDYIRTKLPQTQLILLDDAYQYRKTQPNRTILLTEYNRPYFKDYILPYGRLRERRKEAKRSSYIIITKCPNTLTQNDKQEFINRLHPLPSQKVFFSSIHYKPLIDTHYNTSINTSKNISTNTTNNISTNTTNNISTNNLHSVDNQKNHIVFVAGIDNPMPAVDYLEGLGYKVILRKYPDHHSFTSTEIEELQDLANSHYKLITTEKDAVRLEKTNLPFSILPIENEIDNNFITTLIEDINRK
jgi:tetraacyldisaccharide 4'-kinase